MTTFGSDQLYLLNIFYSKLERILILNKIKKKNNSILIALMEKNLTTISNLLNESSINPSDLEPSLDVTNLLKGNLLRNSDDPNKLNELILTAHGIWNYELNNNKIQSDTIIDYINSTKFTFPALNKKLTENEKLILTSMIGIRTFSRNITLDLRDEHKADNWINIFNLSMKFLLENEIIKKANPLDRIGHEHPISYLLRRANELPQKTRMIYSFVGNNQYYLNMHSGEGELDKDIVKSKFKFLFSKIFDEILTEDLYSKGIEFFTNIANKESKFVIVNFAYINYTWEKLINDSLLSIYE